MTLVSKSQITGSNPETMFLMSPRRIPLVILYVFVVLASAFAGHGEEDKGESNLVYWKAKELAFTLRIDSHDPNLPKYRKSLVG